MTLSALLGRLFSLPAKFFRRFQSGEIAARLMGIMEVKSVMGSSLIPAVFDLVFSVWSLGLLQLEIYCIGYVVMGRVYTDNGLPNN